MLHLLLPLLILLAPRLHAQFNGPADSAKDTVNSPRQITTDLSLLYPVGHEIRLHSGDQLRVTVYGASDYVVSGRITESGTLSLPLIDPVALDGLTVLEAQALIARRLEDAQIFNQPPVQIEVVESLKSQITVLGEVRGTVPGLAGSRRLFDVLASIGGMQPTTSHVVTIDRPGVAQPINVDLGTDPQQSRFANVPVFPGDTILTSRIGSYYMVGAWKVQGVQQLQNTAPLTVLQAYAQAQGRYFEGKVNEVHLIRTVGTTRTLTILRVDDVLKGKAPDPVLQADDILYMPSNKFYAAIRGGGISTALGLALTLVAAIQFVR